MLKTEEAWLVVQMEMTFQMEKKTVYEISPLNYIFKKGQVSIAEAYVI